MKEDHVPQWPGFPCAVWGELVAFEGNSSEHQVLYRAESSALLFCMLGADLHDQTSLEQNTAHLKAEKKKEAPKRDKYFGIQNRLKQGR